MTNRIHEIWPEWNIVEELGSGSYGTVYKAVRTVCGTDFTSAIKVITISADQKEIQTLLAGNPDSGTDLSLWWRGFLKDCINEISSMDLLKGTSHIVSIQDFQIVESPRDAKWEIFLRMEFLKSLNDYMTETESLSEKEILKIGLDICDALKYCGRENIIHRDIKPENIFVSKYGDFKLGDFGIAKIISENNLTHSIKGTQNYMAPEIWKGESYNKNVDYYSLGLLLYYLSNDCRMPFINGDDSFISYSAREEAFFRRIRGEQLPLPKNASPAFAEVICKACEYNPSDRYQTAEEFCEALEKCRTDNPKLSTDEIQNKSSRSIKTVALGALSAVVVIGLIGAVNRFRLNISNNSVTINNYTAQAGGTTAESENNRSGADIREEDRDSTETGGSESNPGESITGDENGFPEDLNSEIADNVYRSFLREYADSWDMNEERKKKLTEAHPDTANDPSYRLLYNLDDLDGNGIDELVMSICTDNDSVHCFDIFTHNEKGDIIDLIPDEDYALDLYDGSLGKIILDGKQQCCRLENGTELVQVSQEEISEKGSNMFWNSIFNLNPDAWVKIREGSM